MPLSVHSTRRRQHSPGFAAALCVVITVIHLEDQNWFSFSKTPGYVQVGYVLLEFAGLVTAGLLLVRPDRAGWLLAAGVALGPFIGYVLSRGPGLPGYTDDKGAWGEPLGVVSLIVEGLLLVTALAALAAPTARDGRTAPAKTAADTSAERHPVGRH